MPSWEEVMNGEMVKKRQRTGCPKGLPDTCLGLFFLARG